MEEESDSFPVYEPLVTMPLQKKPNTIIVYTTIAPEKVIIPIVSCVFGFPLLALLIICCLKHRAKMARERDRRRTANMDRGAMSLVRLNSMHKLGVYLAGGQQAATSFSCGVKRDSLRSERSSSRCYPVGDLDTVLEEGHGEDQELDMTSSADLEDVDSTLLDQQPLPSS